MYLKIGGHQYYLLNFIDEYSRYLVHWELLTSMDGHSISIVAQKALEGLRLDHEGKVTIQPVIRSDNGSGYICKEFGGLLAFHDLTHHRIKPHCPEENGVMERCNRTLREAIEEQELVGRYDSEEKIGRIVWGGLFFVIAHLIFPTNSVKPAAPHLLRLLSQISEIPGQC